MRKSSVTKQVFVHPSAIDDGANIGPGTKIWHFCHIMAGAVIGKNCIIGQNCFVQDNVVIGNGCKIQNNVSVYKGVRLEDDVFIGPSVVFTNVKYPVAAKEIDPCDYGTTLVKNGATIGANATIICGVTIGSHAVVGAGAVVTKDVPAGTTVVGNPAKKIVRWEDCY